jgi:hypothetical protein
MRPSPHCPDDQTDFRRRQMLFTWSTKDLCIVFRSWRVDGALSLLLSLAAIVALGAGYEAVRELSRRYDASVAASRIDASPSKSWPRRCCMTLLAPSARTPPAPRAGTSGGGRSSCQRFMAFVRTRALPGWYILFPRRSRAGPARRLGRVELIVGHRESEAGRQQDERGDQGDIVRPAGLLFVLYYVSRRFHLATAF